MMSLSNKKFVFSLVALLLVVAVLAAYKILVVDRNKADLDERWAASDESSAEVVDHSMWQSLLDDYLVIDDDSGINLFDYSGLLDDGQEPLVTYIDSLTSANPLALNRAEQMPYWINLYNAATVALILDNYPLSSITEIEGAVGSFGPWDNAAVTVNGISLSLNDIEHRILRPLFKDYRIHFAVNCASIGCPDLAENAFTSADMDALLDAAADKYLNHPRAMRFDGRTLTVSTLFKWYAKDFGNTEAEVLETLSNHTSAEMRTTLLEHNGPTEYYYDWSLNGYCSVDNACGN